MELLPKLHSCKEINKLSNKARSPSIVDFLPRGDRSDALRSVLGEETCRNLRKQKWFLVGAGAIGCELLKNAALIGLGAAEASPIQKDKVVGVADNRGLVVTDMDTIEKSNLNRQFFFRSTHVGSYKSTVACQATKDMNPLMKITSLTTAVDKHSNIPGAFDDKFWSSLDGVLTALDNVEARLFVDAQCLKFRKPLIDAGTLATKGSVQVVVPFITETYGDSSDPSDSNENIPICTLKSFPYRSEHTIQWARELFDDCFVKMPEIVTQISHLLTEVNSLDLDLNLDLGGNISTYLSSVGLSEELKEELKVETVVKKVSQLIQMKLQLIQTNQDKDINHNNSSESLWLISSACFDWVFDFILIENFIKPIQHQRRQYGEDAIDTETGLPFWGGHKRRPEEVKIDFQSRFQCELLSHSARLLYRVLIGRQNLSLIELELLSPSEASNHLMKKLSPKILKDTQKSQNKSINLSLGTNQTKAILDLKLKSLIFEKDNDANGQIDFITSASNLRGVSYGIQPMERLQVKRIAGRILPAIATTTAAVSALSCIELIKIVQMNSASNQKLNKTKEEENLKYVKRFQKDQRVKKLHNSFLNLAVPLFSISEPVHAQEFSLGISEDSHENNNKRNTFTIWDVFDVNPKKEKLPLAELVRRIEECSGRGSTVQSLSLQDGMILYSTAQSQPSSQVFDNLCEQVSISQGKTFVDLEVFLQDSNDQSVLDFPTIRYWL
mmetsp:Transcript_36108/g.46540  ORF Transcript_36108/g.46540 Transcript_36108/m.46540 type:complete len:726 (+) Transcript_36108:2119-4296(+)